MPIPKTALQSTITPPDGVVITMVYTWPRRADHALVKTEVRAAGSQDLLSLTLGSTDTLEDTGACARALAHHVRETIYAVADQYGWSEPF
uniref:Uncharacterized protein n=1 Tax=uncultured prokaryote TaxID=198431 RepID=A0A0H5Q6X3_9ZZZZ|nr:hypothetical protein [uncultured prokaryote]